jgi:hypothetical protein
LQSHHNCLSAIVHIGEMSIEILPESERFYPVASEIVKSTYYALTVVESVEELFSHILPISGVSPYLGSLPRHHDKRLICPLRFSDVIENATAIYNNIPNITPKNGQCSCRDHLLQTSDIVLRGRPPSACHKIVKALFVRDLVDVRQARLGYADFLLWCRYEISLEDSLLYRYV